MGLDDDEEEPKTCTLCFEGIKPTWSKDVLLGMNKRNLWVALQAWVLN